MKSVTLTDVQNGETFILDDVAFIKLDEDENAAFVMACDCISDKMPFKCPFIDRYGNNFVGSDIRILVHDWLTSHPEITKAVIDRQIDLTSISGEGGYGKPLVHGRILTIDEYIKYRTMIPGYAKEYWLATPGCGIDPTSLIVDVTRMIHSRGSWESIGCCVPTLYLDPGATVYVAREEEKVGLESYTDAELLEELLKRNISLKVGDITRTLYEGEESK